MILLNKYKRWYDRIIEIAKGRIVEGYFERHHIIPKCCGGINDPNNVVCLLPREHYICHVLLTKFYTGSEKHKLLCAVHRIVHNNKLNGQIYHRSSYLYAKLKVERNVALNEMNSGENNPNFGRCYSKEMRRTMHQNRDNTNIGKYKRSESEKKRLKEQLLENHYIKKGLGNPMNNPEYRKKISDSKIGKRIYIHSITGDRRYFFPGSQPDMFVLKG